MDNILNIFKDLLKSNNIEIPKDKEVLLNEFLSKETTNTLVNNIINLQNKLMTDFNLQNLIHDIREFPLYIPNATVGKKYETKIDFNAVGWNNIIFSEMIIPENYGLSYDNESETIKGIPLESGDFKIKFLYRIKNELETSELNEKLIPIVINADPKSLWKNISSNENDIYWKLDNAENFEPLGDKHIVVSSKRGRSHANVGSFRDDDYAFKHFEKIGWSVVAVSDGAGSARVSRKGSEIACKAVLGYFENSFNEQISIEFDNLIKEYHKESIIKQVTTENLSLKEEKDTKTLEEEIVKEPAGTNLETNSNKISKFVYNYLGNAAKSVYEELDNFAISNEISIKDLHSTLIFAMFKKYDFGYIILSFGVGDCPIGVLYNNSEELKLMNWLDVGEFGGGTRFITMPEIFNSDKFSSRFGFKKITGDFSFLILMTDGIYDAKFVVESNLEKTEKWKEFLEDLSGKNEENNVVEFNKNNLEISNQLSSWMDFWSPGNHDDRTLAIVF